MSSIMLKNNILKQAHKLLTTLVLSKKMLEYVTRKQRKLRTSINKPYNVIIIMFKLLGAPFASNVTVTELWYILPLYRVG